LLLHQFHLPLTRQHLFLTRLHQVIGKERRETRRASRDERA